MRKKSAQSSGAEAVRWDLSFLYAGIDDPKLDADLKDVARRCRAFDEGFRGKLSSKLGDALRAYADL